MGSQDVYCPSCSSSWGNLNSFHLELGLGVGRYSPCATGFIAVGTLGFCILTSFIFESRSIFFKQKQQSPRWLIGRRQIIGTAGGMQFFFPSIHLIRMTLHVVAVPSCYLHLPHDIRNINNRPTWLCVLDICTVISVPSVHKYNKNFSPS